MVNKKMNYHALIGWGIIIFCLSYLIIGSYNCNDKTIVGEADDYEFRRCQCLHKGSTYRCHATNNFHEGVLSFLKVGKYNNMQPIYYFRAETIGLK